MDDLLADVCIILEGAFIEVEVSGGGLCDVIVSGKSLVPCSLRKNIVVMVTGL